MEVTKVKRCSAPKGEYIYPLDEIELGLCTLFGKRSDIDNHFQYPEIDRRDIAIWAENNLLIRCSHITSNIYLLSDPMKICIALYDGIDTPQFNRVVLLFNDRFELDSFIFSIKGLYCSKMEVLSMNEKSEIDNHNNKRNEIISMVKNKGFGGKRIPCYTKQEKQDFMKIFNSLKDDSFSYDETYQMIQERVKSIVGDGRYIGISEKKSSNYSIRDIIYTLFNS
ncbi:hypothetical protein MASR1M31_04520 [Porphyromonadaceae bacterium]